MSSVAEIYQPTPLRRANDAFAAGLTPPRALFGEFWREGELALLFGAAGTGKSLLAVHLAESLARGSGFDGFDGPCKPLSVLYVDLVLSDSQFVMRYSQAARGGKRRGYRFSARFFRDRPADAEPLAIWLRRCVVEQKIKAVVIDDLSVVTRSADGTRETFELVHELRKMTRELGVSIMVLADSLAPVFERDIAERDLRRTRVLCGYSDSVFAIETAPGAGRRNLVQTRSQAGNLVWTHRRPAQFTIEGRDDGLIEFEVYRTQLTPAMCETITRIKKMRDAGSPFRTIAKALKIPKSTVARLHSKWPPERAAPLLQEEGWHPDVLYRDDGVVGERPVVVKAEPAVAEPEKRISYNFREETYRGEFTDEYLASIGLPPMWKKPSTGSPPYEGGVAPASGDGVVLSTAFEQPDSFADAENHPVGETPPTLLRQEGSLEAALDAYGREILIESREKHSGRPLVWYQTDKKGTTRRFRRDLLGINIERLDNEAVQHPP